MMSTAACETFDKILDCVKKSNLNFCMQLSPFSANISLKKTFVKDKAGVYLNPPVSTVSVQDPDTLYLKNKDLTKKVNDLEIIIDKLNWRLKAYEEKEMFEKKVKMEKIETDQADLVEESHKHHLEQKSKEISILHDEKKVQDEHVISLQTLIKERDMEIQDLQGSLQKSECAVKRLNKLVNTNEFNHEKEIKLITKNLKNEIKLWKKDLGSERSKKINAERTIATLKITVNNPRV